MKFHWPEKLCENLNSQYPQGPRLIKGLALDEIAALPGPAHIDKVLGLRALNFATVRMVREGRPIPTQAYQKMNRGLQPTPSVDLDRTSQLLRSGATLSINDFHHVDITALSLVDDIERLLGVESEAVLFITPAGNPGFKPHTDEIGVIAVQVTGTKDWTVWPRLPGSDRGSGTYNLEDLGTPEFQITLGPGDVLILPHGTPHAATATHEMSIHLSLGLRAPSRNQRILDTIQSFLPEEGWSDEAPANCSQPPEALKSIDERSWQDAWHRARHRSGEAGSDSESQEVLQGPIEALAGADTVASDTVVMVTSDTAIEFGPSSKEGFQRVRARGITSDLPSDLAELIESAADGTIAICANDLPASIGPLPDKVRALKKLVRLGLVER